jgi:hypothetical protein
MGELTIAREGLAKAGRATLSHFHQTVVSSLE